MKLFVAAALALSSSTAWAQPTPVVAQPAAATLVRGTEVPLRMLSALNSSDFKVGDTFDLEVAEAVMLNGAVVIPIGARAVGEVTKRSGKGMWGRSGKLETKLRYVMINNQKVAISGESAQAGKGGTAGAVGAALVVPVAGFFITGKAAVIPAGTRVAARLEEEVPVLLAPTTPIAPAVMPAVATQPVPVASAPAVVVPAAIIQ